MTAKLRLALTADLHWGVRPSGNQATQLLVESLRADPPDILVVAGDVGAGQDFERCLALFDDLSCRKLLVPGNHDIWVEEEDARGDSLELYRQHLPHVCATHGFHYLDRAPALFPEADLGIVGSINWYDYSWTIERLCQVTPDWESRLKHKLFTRGRHNDARFVRWAMDDVGFTAEVVAALERHLDQALNQVGRLLVVTHHPPFHGLSFPRPGPPSLDGLLWDAFSGNKALEEILIRHAAHIPFAFCGHTHREREHTLNSIRGFNIGGDYHFKRLLRLQWPDGRMEAHVFGNPAVS